VWGQTGVPITAQLDSSGQLVTEDVSYQYDGLPRRYSRGQDKRIRQDPYLDEPFQLANERFSTSYDHYQQ
jgi:hypothetical protein